MPFSNSISGNKIIADWALVGAICLAYILRTNPVIYFEGGDNAHYLLLAKAIAGGRGYRDIFLAGSPVHTQYPPMFPALLALVILFKGMDLRLMNLIVSLGAAASIVLTFVLLKRRSFSLPVLPIIWFACSLNFFSQSDWLLSETVYMAFSAGALLACDKWLKEGGWNGAVVGLMMCWAAELTRTAGVALAISIGITVLLAGKSRRSATSAIAATLLCLIPFIGWTARNFISRDVSTDYVSQFFRADPYDPSKGQVDLYWFAVRIFENLKSHGADLANLLNGGLVHLPEIVAIFGALLLFVLMALGFCRRIRGGAGPIEIYSILYFAMIMAWPFPGYRFMMPVYPFALAYAIEGAYFIFNIKLAQRPAPRRVIAALFAILFLFSLATNFISSQRYRRSIMQKISDKEYEVLNGIKVMPLSDNHARLLEACKWLANNGGPDAIVMTRLSRLVALASGKTVINCPQTLPPDPGAWIRLKGIKFIIIDEVYPDTIDFMLAMTKGRNEAPGLTRPVQIGDTVVVEVNTGFNSR